jgi:HAD superfamily hydrolase (TIGR01493 family)
MSGPCVVCELDPYFPISAHNVELAVDVIGTCCEFHNLLSFLSPTALLVGYDSVTDSLRDVFASQAALSGTIVPPGLFFSAWFAVHFDGLCRSLYSSRTSNAEVDFQRLSLVQKFRSHSTLLKKAFYKTMKDAEIPTSSIPEADVDLLISQYSESLTPRPGLSEMIQTLRDGGFTVWCCSDASPERVKGYFDKAGIDMPMENLLSCNMCEAAKPDPRVYKMVKKALGRADVTVFAAAHAWDLAGARKEG